MTTVEQASVIRWEDPPPPARRGAAVGGRPPGSVFDRIAADLIAGHGRWALIRDTASSSTASQMAADIRAGRPRCFAPAGDFDACARAVDGRYRVYARYLGDGGDA